MKITRKKTRIRSGVVVVCSLSCNFPKHLSLRSALFARLDKRYTEEKKPVYGYSSPSYALYDFDLKQWNAGLFHLLGHICNKCDYETFKMALSCRGCKLDAYTLMECIKKGDIRYLELIGKDKFAEHPTLRLPLHLRDPRFCEPKDVIVYETAKTIVNAESYNPQCRELLATWGLEFV